MRAQKELQEAATDTAGAIYHEVIRMKNNTGTQFESLIARWRRRAAAAARDAEQYEEGTADNRTLVAKATHYAHRANELEQLALGIGDASPVSGAIPFHPKSEAWIEAGHHSDSGAELRLAFAGPLPTGHSPFWIPISAPDGSALGWMQFGYLTTVRQKSLFGATAWRSANESAPPEQDVLPLPLALLPAGFSPRS